MIEFYTVNKTKQILGKKMQPQWEKGEEMCHYLVTQSNQTFNYAPKVYLTSQYLFTYI